VRASALRTALERATGEIATAATTNRPGTLRITVPVPTGSDDPRWRGVLRALESAGRWGSTDSAGRTVVWAEIREDL
jgi:hypothetical protein